MRTALFTLLLALALPALADGPEIDPTLTPTKTLVCDLPVTREDGTALDVGEIAEVRIYQSQDSATWEPVGQATDCRMVLDLTALSDGQYYYTATAVDVDGRESVYGNVVPFMLLRIPPPTAPTLRLEG